MGSEEDEGEGDIKLQVMHCVFRIMCESVKSVRLKTLCVNNDKTFIEI